MKSGFYPLKPIQDDNDFINHTTLIKKIVACLDYDKSCLLYGGQGMGKTSTLLHIHRLFRNAARNGRRSTYVYVPIYLSLKFRLASSFDLFDRMLEHTNRQVGEWLSISNIKMNHPLINHPRVRLVQRQEQTHQVFTQNLRAAFREDLRQVVSMVSTATGDDIKLLFLFDDLQSIFDRNLRAEFVEHWFDLLDMTDEEQDSGVYLAMILACSQDIKESFVSERVNLNLHYSLPKIFDEFELKIPDKEDVRKALTRIFTAFSQDLPDTLEDKIIDFTGGHPSLLHFVGEGLLRVLQEEGHLSSSRLLEYFDKWYSTTTAAHYWLENVIGNLEHSVLNDKSIRELCEILLCQEHPWKAPNPGEDRKALKSALEHRTAIRVLEFTGLICETSPSTYTISGQLLRAVLAYKIVTINDMNTLEGEKTVESPQQQITQVVTQLDELLLLTNDQTLAAIYEDKGLQDELRAQLIKQSADLTALSQQLQNLRSQNYLPGDRSLANYERDLLSGIERIRLEIKININPKLQAIANRLAEKAETTEAQDKTMIQRAREFISEAASNAPKPILQAAALAKAIEILVKFFQKLSE
jgi:hypothetical protein